MRINAHAIWVYIVVGFIPYSMERRQTSGGHTLEIRALFWTLQHTRRQWTIHIPLIQRLRDGIWTVIRHLQKDGHSEE